MRVVVEVDRDVRRVGVAEDALQLLLGGALIADGRYGFFDLLLVLVERLAELGDVLTVEAEAVRR